MVQPPTHSSFTAKPLPPTHWATRQSGASIGGNPPPQTACSSSSSYSSHASGGSNGTYNRWISAVRLDNRVTIDPALPEYITTGLPLHYRGSRFSTTDCRKNASRCSPAPSQSNLVSYCCNVSICLKNVDFLDSDSSEFVRYLTSRFFVGSLSSTSSEVISDTVYFISLDLSENRITCEGLQIITEWFIRHHRYVRLRNLKVYKNMVSDGAALALAELIMIQPTAIEELHLSHNRITNIGAAALFKSFSHARRNGHNNAFVYPRQAVDVIGRNSGICYLPVWIRLEYNYIADTQAILQKWDADCRALRCYDANARLACFADRPNYPRGGKDPHCSPARCLRSAHNHAPLLHLYSFSHQSTPNVDEKPIEKISTERLEATVRPSSPSTAGKKGTTKRKVVRNSTPASSPNTVSNIGVASSTPLSSSQLEHSRTKESSNIPEPQLQVLPVSHPKQYTQHSQSLQESQSLSQSQSQQRPDIIDSAVVGVGRVQKRANEEYQSSECPYYPEPTTCVGTPGCNTSALPNALPLYLFVDASAFAEMRRLKNGSDVNLFSFPGIFALCQKRVFCYSSMEPILRKSQRHPQDLNEEERCDANQSLILMVVNSVGEGLLSMTDSQPFLREALVNLQKDFVGQLSQIGVVESIDDLGEGSPGRWMILDQESLDRAKSLNVPMDALRVIDFAFIWAHHLAKVSVTQVSENSMLRPAFALFVTSNPRVERFFTTLMARQKNMTDRRFMHSNGTTHEPSGNVLCVTLDKLNQMMREGFPRLAAMLSEAGTFEPTDHPYLVGQEVVAASAMRKLIRNNLNSLPLILDSDYLFANRVNGRGSLNEYSTNKLYANSIPDVYRPNNLIRTLQDDQIPKWDTSETPNGNDATNSASEELQRLQRDNARWKREVHKACNLVTELVMRANDNFPSHLVEEDLIHRCKLECAHWEQLLSAERTIRVTERIGNTTTNAVGASGGCIQLPPPPFQSPPTFQPFSFGKAKALATNFSDDNIYRLSNYRDSNNREAEDFLKRHTEFCSATDIISMRRYV